MQLLPVRASCTLRFCGSSISGDAEPADAAVPVVAGEAEALAKLEACIAAHRPALSLREMDVFEDRVLIRCADCRLHYDLSVAQFEMRQK